MRPGLLSFRSQRRALRPSALSRHSAVPPPGSPGAPFRVRIIGQGGGAITGRLLARKTGLKIGIGPRGGDMVR